MEFTDLMRNFGADFGLADFAPDDDGAWNVVIDGMPVSFTELDDPPRLRMSAPVCELPENEPEALLQEMLEGMFMGQSTGGAVFSVAEGDGTVLLRRTDPLLTLDFGGFKAILQRFVNILERWRKTAETGLSSAAGAEDVRQPPASAMRMMNASGFLRI